jgi:hypothetical protein
VACLSRRLVLGALARELIAVRGCFADIEIPFMDSALSARPCRSSWPAKRIFVMPRGGVNRRKMLNLKNSS